ncbi:MAG: YjbF family lipoprotein [Rhodobacteraceae bacterium]|nr:YjbF family lipoprotein [Paracoccaceae bacterium]
MRGASRQPARLVLPVLALAAGLVLTACGNDTSRTEGSKIALDVAKSVKARLVARKKGPGPAPDPEALASTAMASFPGPLIMVGMEKSGVVSAMGEYGRNGANLTYASPAQQTMTFRGGLLVATRGLGHDLMSAELGSAATLIAQRAEGEYQRANRYLDGEGLERPLPMTCSLKRGGSEQFAFAGTTYATEILNETCRSTGLTVTNAYWVTRDGTIARSRQWIGPALGYAGIQLVRGESH